ncbi:ECF transporter S component [Nonomuraea sp. NPDC003804]|uniref:ECF transporter S component n=1 Tax=Nonomuraea sp. NPDC003804 TaxID=3154547 RepID=UPI0033A64EB1
MSTEAVSPRPPLWEINSRVVVFAAVGAALYAVLGLISFTIPGTQLVDVRPAFALVMFFGIRFGPIVGLFTGLVGNIVIDTIKGYGTFTYWHWSVSNALAGLLAAVLFALLASRIKRQAWRLIVVGIIAELALALGFLFSITDMWLQGSAFETWLATAYGPLLVSNTLVALILTPALDAVWEPIAARVGR